MSDEAPTETMRDQKEPPNTSHLVSSGDPERTDELAAFFDEMLREDDQDPVLVA